VKKLVKYQLLIQMNLNEFLYLNTKRKTSTKNSILVYGECIRKNFIRVSSFQGEKLLLFERM